MRALFGSQHTAQWWSSFCFMLIFLLKLHDPVFDAPAMDRVLETVFISCCP